MYLAYKYIYIVHGAWISVPHPVSTILELPSV